MTVRGLFVGLITLDLVYRVEALPQPNEKCVALDSTLAAGGPATNAAVTFSHLGHSRTDQATVLGVLGQHPMRHLILEDLNRWRVAIADLNPQHPDPPPASSILVTAATGDRAVVSLNAVRCQAEVSQIPPDILEGIDIVLIDGHQMAVGAEMAAIAQSRQIPVVVDGGSWKPGFETVLHHADYAICSANFFPPGCDHEADVMRYLSALGVPFIAITHGDQPISYKTPTHAGTLPVFSTQAIDTLGAGDVFHGAFCHHLMALASETSRSEEARFVEALAQAAQVAAQSCQAFGTREWMIS